MIFVQTGAVHL